MNTTARERREKAEASLQRAWDADGPAPQELWAGRVRVPEAARVCFRADVEAELEARGVLGEPGNEGVDLDPGESPF